MYAEYTRPQLTFPALQPCFNHSLKKFYQKLFQVSKKVPNHLQNSVDHQTHSNLEFVEGKKSSVKESFSRENEVSAKSASLGRKKRGVMNGHGCVPWNGERVRIKVYRAYNQIIKRL